MVMHFSWKMAAASAVVAMMISGLSAAPASAQDTGGTLSEVMEQALEEVGAPAAVENDAVELPADADEPAVLEVGGATLEMSIPATGEAEESGDTTSVFVDDGSSIAVQSTEEGVRALIHIDSPDAPERYEFEIGGDVASLEITDDGGVVARGDLGEPIAFAAPPWAVDANGTEVPTHFELDGTTLHQVVEHHGGNYAYGIVADPWWNPFSWNWTKIKSVMAKGAKKTGQVSLCSAAIVMAVVPAAKGAKLVKDLGGVRKAAELFVGAGKVSDLKVMLPGVAASVLGIALVVEKCGLKK